MKKIVLSLLIVTLLAACQPAATPVPPTPTIDPVVQHIGGNYLIAISLEESKTSPGIDSGDYLLKLGPDMRFFWVDANDPGWVAVQGTYTVTADQIVFKTTSGAVAAECVGTSGTYQWSLVGQALAFTPVSDECAGQKWLLTLRPLVKQP